MQDSGLGSNLNSVVPKSKGSKFHRIWLKIDLFLEAKEKYGGFFTIWKFEWFLGTANEATAWDHLFWYPHMFEVFLTKVHL